MIRDPEQRNAFRPSQPCRAVEKRTVEAHREQRLQHVRAPGVDTRGGDVEGGVIPNVEVEPLCGTGSADNRTLLEADSPVSHRTAFPSSKQACVDGGKATTTPVQHGEDGCACASTGTTVSAPVVTLALKRRHSTPMQLSCGTAGAAAADGNAAARDGPPLGLVGRKRPLGARDDGAATCSEASVRSQGAPVQRASMPHMGGSASHKSVCSSAAANSTTSSSPRGWLQAHRPRCPSQLHQGTSPRGKCEGGQENESAGNWARRSVGPAPTAAPSGPSTKLPCSDPGRRCSDAGGSTEAPLPHCGQLQRISVPPTSVPLTPRNSEPLPHTCSQLPCVDTALDTVREEPGTRPRASESAIDPPSAPQAGSPLPSATNDCVHQHWEETVEAQRVSLERAAEEVRQQGRQVLAAREYVIQQSELEKKALAKLREQVKESAVVELRAELKETMRVELLGELLAEMRSRRAAEAKVAALVERQEAELKRACKLEGRVGELQDQVAELEGKEAEWEGLRAALLASVEAAIGGKNGALRTTRELQERVAQGETLAAALAMRVRELEGELDAAGEREARYSQRSGGEHSDTAADTVAQLCQCLATSSRGRHGS